MSRKPAAGKARLRRTGPGVLLILSIFLIASGVIRIGDGTGVAIAREISALINAAEAAPPSNSEDTPGFEELLAAVRAREARLEDAEIRLAERERTVALATDEIDAKLVALAEAEANLQALLTVADSAADEDVARLTAMYESMKPAEAAALFEQMDPAFAAGFLARMRADAAGAVLAGLPPEKAYALSVVLAGRNSSVLTD